MRQSSPWIQVFSSQENAVARIFCFSFAGGGTQSFNEWPQSLPGDVEVCAIRLPGREVHINEAPLSSMKDVIDGIMKSNCLNPYLDKPFFLFGHSLGALVAFELARRLEDEKRLKPEKLIVSGRVAPHRKPPREPIYDLPDDQFMEALEKLGGTPPEILEDADLMAMILPTLRADFSVNENYVYNEKPSLSCDIIAFGGLQDTETTRKEIDAWRDATSGTFSLRMVPGNHFFIQSARKLFLRLLSFELYEAMGALPEPCD